VYYLQLPGAVTQLDTSLTEVEVKNLQTRERVNHIYLDEGRIALPGRDDGINDNDDDDGANCTNGRAEQQRFFGLIMSKYLGERAASSFQCGAALLFVEVAISSKRADKQTYLALHDE
jgi:hypothetical protein